VSVVNKIDALKVLAAVGLLVVVLGTVIMAAWGSPDLSQIPNAQLGSQIFNVWGVTFFILGMLMFVAMMGGVFLAQEED
jgi:NADH:ubiquinone oxidoreductase subunit 6 (subunit J)